MSLEFFITLVLFLIVFLFLLRIWHYVKYSEGVVPKAMEDSVKKAAERDKSTIVSIKSDLRLKNRAYSIAEDIIHYMVFLDFKEEDFKLPDLTSAQIEMLIGLRQEYIRLVQIDEARPEYHKIVKSNGFYYVYTGHEKIYIEYKSTYVFLQEETAIRLLKK